MRFGGQKLHVDGQIGSGGQNNGKRAELGCDWLKCGLVGHNEDWLAKKKRIGGINGMWLDTTVSGGLKGW